MSLFARGDENDLARTGQHELKRAGKYNRYLGASQRGTLRKGEVMWRLSQEGLNLLMSRRAVSPFRNTSKLKTSERPAAPTSGRKQSDNKRRKLRGKHYLQRSLGQEHIDVKNNYQERKGKKKCTGTGEEAWSVRPPH